MNEPTPITDAAKVWARVVDQADIDPPHEEMVPVDKCEEIERELAAVTKEIDAARVEAKKYFDKWYLESGQSGRDAEDIRGEIYSDNHGR